MCHVGWTKRLKERGGNSNDGDRAASLINARFLPEDKSLPGADTTGKGRLFPPVSFGPAPARFGFARPNGPRGHLSESFRLWASLTDIPRGARTAPVTGLFAGRGAEGTT